MQLSRKAHIVRLEEATYILVAWTAHSFVVVMSRRLRGHPHMTSATRAGLAQKQTRGYVDVMANGG